METRFLVVEAYGKDSASLRASPAAPAGRSRCLAAVFLIAALRLCACCASEPASAIGDGSGGFSSHLPLVILELGGDGAAATSVPAVVRIVDNPNGTNRPGDRPALQSRARLRRHGDAGDEGKRGYSIAFVAENGEAQSRTVPGMGEGGAWTLLGSSKDRMMLRAAIALELAKVIAPAAAPEARYCEVLVDDAGRYRYEGLYLLTENMENGVALSPRAMRGRKYVVRCDIVSGVSEGEGAEVSDAPAWRRPFSHGRAALAFPATPSEPGLGDEAATELKKTEDTIASDESAAFFSYLSLLDVDSFINAYIMNGVMENHGVGLPFAFEKRDGVIGLLPIWNFDEALDNAVAPRAEDDFTAGRYVWLDRLRLSAGFMEKLRNRYYSLVRNELKPPRVDALVDSLYLRLGTAMRRDWTRWRAAYEAVDAPPSRRIADAEQDAVRIKRRLRHQGERMRSYLTGTAWYRYQFDYDMDARRNFVKAAVFIVVFFALTRYARRRVR